MDEFDDRRGVDMPAAAMATGSSCQEHQKGAKTLAAGVYKVSGYLVNQCYLAVQALFDDLVDSIKISSYQRTNLF